LESLSNLDRRKVLASRIGDLLGADVWLWFLGEVNTELRGDSMVTSFVSGGFSDEEEQAEFFRVIINPELTPAVTAPLGNAVLSQKSLTCRRSQLISDDEWEMSSHSIRWRQLGFDDFIIAAFPSGPTSYSALGFHRRLGRPRFTQKECNLVQMVFQSVSWLHQSEGLVEAADTVLELTPRERHVMMFLLNGDSRKEIARKLSLSEHTVSDYLKAIYRKFGVNSRTELLAKFISRNSDT
jgi:DNA-binding CsgD family transcriptional regulator